VRLILTKITTERKHEKTIISLAILAMATSSWATNQATNGSIPGMQHISDFQNLQPFAPQPVITPAPFRGKAN